MVRSLAAGLPRRSRPGSICITGIYRQRGPAWRQNRACPRYVISLDSSSRDGRVWRSFEEEREKEREGETVEDTERDGDKRRFGKRRLRRSLCAAYVAEKERTRYPKKPARREKSVGASTQRPMTSSELFASLESFSRQKSCSLFLCISSSFSISLFAIFFLQLPFAISDSSGI